MKDTLNKLFKIYVVMMFMLLSFSEYMIAKYIIIALSIATFTLIMFTFFSDTNTNSNTNIKSYTNNNNINNNSNSNNLITKVNIYRGMTKKELDNILSNVKYTLDDIDVQILKLFYVERKELYYIAQILPYSVDNIQKRKTKAIENINKYYNDNNNTTTNDKDNTNNNTNIDKDTTTR